MCEITKKCRQCKFEYPATLEYWHRQSRGKYGLRAVCKDCVSKNMRVIRCTDEYREKRRTKMREWRNKNHEKQLTLQRRSWDKHKDVYNSKRRLRRENDPVYRMKCIEYDRKYSASGRRNEMNSKPEQLEKTRLRTRKRRQNPTLNKHDREIQAIWRTTNKEYLHEKDVKRRTEMDDSYIAGIMGLSVKDINKENIETKRLIIKLKRELKKLNIKIR